MKWIIDEPKSGDMIRVKAGSIYHYGIFIGDEEVIQFGLSPAITALNSDKAKTVVATRIDAFLQGEFLEVASYDKKEIRKKKTAQEIIKTARMRLGENGYHFLYNNCEHFAYECVFGQKKSEQVANYAKVLPFVDAYYAEIPEKVKLSKVYPLARQADIESTSHALVKAQKYYVWKLLEFAIKKSFNLRLKDINFTKNDNGQWVCDKLFFSLSHCKNLVAVAVSNYSTGIDVEYYDQGEFNEKLAKKALNTDEMAEFESLDKSARGEYFITKWTKKESEFKRLSKKVFEPTKLDTTRVFSQSISACGDNFILSVASFNGLAPRKISKVKLK